MQDYYNISYTVVSLVFLPPFAGYVLAAAVCDLIHIRLGRRGIAIIGPSAHLICYIIAACHPPYPLLVIGFVISGFGNGLVDGSWNAFVGNMQNPNQVLGVLHGSYGVGATLAPLIATSMVTKGGLEWYYFYYMMVSFSLYPLLLSFEPFFNPRFPLRVDRHWRP